jgi:hypothetical protein
LNPFGKTGSQGLLLAAQSLQWQERGTGSDLVATSFSYTDALVAVPVFTQRTNLSGDIVRAGINYRFNWTPWGVLFGNERMTF